jgi:membrane-bound metal-dependent hydrolase YbcI (DUF457 family)
MTIYEHAILGINGALALGLQNRYDWQIVALEGVVAILPDWDGLSIVLGMKWYSLGHRVWGHNFLVAGVLAAVVSWAIYRFEMLSRIQQWLAAHWTAFAENGHTIDVQQSDRGTLAVWIIVGLGAAYSHLLADTVFSIGKNLPLWGVPLFWPFSTAEIAFPLVPWGDIGATIIFAASRFLMLRWPKKTSQTAFASLALVVCYIVMRDWGLGIGY